MRNEGREVGRGKITEDPECHGKLMRFESAKDRGQEIRGLR